MLLEHTQRSSNVMPSFPLHGPPGGVGWQMVQILGMKATLS